MKLISDMKTFKIYSNPDIVTFFLTNHYGEDALEQIEIVEDVKAIILKTKRGDIIQSLQKLFRTEALK